MESTSELRLGNIVKVDGKIYQVYSLDSCFVGLCKVGKDELLFDVDVKNVEPVELTEETLTEFCAFRFKSIPAKMYHLAEDENVFDLDRDIFIIQIENKFSISFKNSSLCDVQYVHHLQNLFHSIKNQELVIKI